MAEGLDVSGLGPVDAAAAVRSFARRFRALLAPLDANGSDDNGWDDDDPAGADDADPDELAYRPGADGASALDHAAAAAATFNATIEALQSIRSDAEPAIASNALGIPATSGSARGESIASILETFDEIAEALAEAVRAMSADEWARDATLDGGKINALDVVRRSIATGAGHLRGAERALATARRSP